MSDKSKIFLADARDAAERICRLLEAACERIEIAGSIRRRAALVGDIEIVCQPRLQLDPGALIAGNEISALDRHVERICGRQGSDLQFDVELVRRGTRYKRLAWWGVGSEKIPRAEINVDLFCVLPPASWGAIMVIRTGPDDFSRGLVTRRTQGGAMPEGLRQRDGALWGPSGRIDTPEEADYFAALGVPYWPPEERTAERLVEYLAAVAGQHEE